MTVPSSVNKISYNGNNATVTFNVPFYFLVDEDLQVYVSGVLKAQPGDYTVSGAGNPAGGSITFGVAPATGTGNVIILRKPDLLQETDYQSNDPFPAESHERALDKLTMIAQSQQEEIDRSIKLAVGDPRTSDELLEDILGTDAAVAANAAAAAASAAAAAVSESNAVGAEGTVLAAVTQALEGQKDLFISGSDYTSGVSTELTLSSVPAKPGTVKVFFDGVYQNQTEWSLAGSVITFTDAIVSGEVEVAYEIPSQLVGISNISSSRAIGGTASALPSAPLEYRRITLQDGTRVSIPIYTAVEPLDLFIIVGQSNAEGRGDSAQSPAAPEGVYISGTTITQPLADPVGGADTGSMWPAWSNEWFARTGRMSAFVEAAQGGTGLLVDAGGQWSPSGTLRAAAVAAANNAITAIDGASTFELGDLYFVWCQGENDAAATNGTTVTAPLYKDALKVLADYFKAQLPTMQDFFVVATGITGTTGPLLTQTVLNYAAIRKAQYDAATENSLIVPVYDGTISFPAKLLMEDSVHYSQAGLNLVGKVAARAATGNGFVPQAPAVLASTAYADIVDANKTTRTIAYTVAPGAKTAILIMQGGRTSTFPTITATYGGVSMSPICSARAQNGSPTNIMVAFVIKNLSGLASGDFVISSSLTLVNLHVSVIEFLDDVWLTGIGSNISTLGDTVQTHDIFAGTEATVISAVSTQSVAAASVSFVGATELEEMSLFRTSGAAYHTLAIASADVAALSNTTIQTTHSTTCTIINALSIAVRKAFSDESF